MYFISIKRNKTNCLIQKAQKAKTKPKEKLQNNY